MAFVNLIPVAAQCSSTARIGPHHCGHRIGEVLSSDKHWHAVLVLCLVLLDSFDSSTAVSAVTGRSGLQVTVLGHCQALPYDLVTCFHDRLLPNVENSGAVLQALPASALIHCLIWPKTSSMNSGWSYTVTALVRF